MNALDATVWVFAVYFAIINVASVLLLFLGWRGIRAYLANRSLEDHGEILRAPSTPPISIIVPAYDEQPVIVASVMSLLRTRFGHFEVMVVNDGSRDDTLGELRRAFDLVELPRVPRTRLATAEVRGVYVSRRDPRLIVVDKVNGGKADAINAGLSFARYPLFCAVDSDTMLDDDALLRLVRPFVADPAVVACGGVVRIANGSRSAAGRITEVRAPRKLLLNIQIVEYLRAFLAGRVGWSRLGGLLIISGAFGLFDREAVLSVGGYARGCVGEDAELVIRLHRRLRERGEDYRVVFVADPVCWTQAPTSLRVLARQRDRWQRGLWEALLRHRRMVGRPRYGVPGVLAMPYFLVFEALGPLIEAAGLTITATGLVSGRISPALAATVFALSVTFGLVLSFGALMIEERGFRRYRSWRCTLRLSVAAVLENVGYRQWLTLVRVWATFSLLSGTSRWGDMPREAFERADDIGLPLAVAAATGTVASVEPGPA